MDFIRLKYFVTTANSDSMQKAAEILNVSQSTISVAIKGLERELGVTLFRKQGRRLVLTDAGRALKAGAADILLQVENLRQQMLLYQGLTEDRIYIESEVPDFSTNTEVLGRSLWSDYKIIQHRPPRHAVRPLLRTGQVDFAVTLSDITDSTIESFLILDEPVFLIVNEKHPAAAQKRMDLSQLGEQTLVSLPREYSFRSLCEHIFALAGLRLDSVHEVFDPESIPLAVIKGAGVGFIPRSTYYESKPDLSGKIRAVELNDAFCTRSVYLSRLKGKELSDAAMDFWNLMVQVGEWIQAHTVYPAAQELI